ncbi:hypothetical protein [Nostoc sp. UHCC 0870]|uniref:hypothetical protein n=1 Tax=Nostoc sp. UHCC 0870 TaxID=2914041 RepID=UPI001EE14912|nr:hypothetical protein [Nostoc sp. UHCC 0870]UKO97316.1 hypothetical protein L6494_22470 [Nostoc sp. UHCC 0870]
MNENRLFFRLLSAEESCVVSGGAMPFFDMNSTEQNTQGRIINADGYGQDVTIYGSQTSDKKTQPTAAPYQEIALPSMVDVTPTRR